MHEKLTCRLERAVSLGLEMVMGGVIKSLCYNDLIERAGE